MHMLNFLDTFSVGVTNIAMCGLCGFNILFLWLEPMYLPLCWQKQKSYIFSVIEKDKYFLLQHENAKYV